MRREEAEIRRMELQLMRQLLMRTVSGLPSTELQPPAAE